MSAAGENHVTPIRVWIRAVMLAILIYLCGFAVMSYYEIKILQAPPDLSEFEQTASNLENDEQAADVYIFGSSLSRLALSQGGFLKSAIEERDLSFTFRTQTRRKVVLSDFSHMIPQLQSDLPELVLIESNILCLNMFERSLNEKRVTPKKLLYRYESHLALTAEFLRMHLWRALKSMSLPVPRESKIIDEDYWSLYQKHAKNYTVREVNDFPEWVSYFQNARELGTRVVILELPRSVQAVQYLPENFQEEYEALIGLFMEEYGVEYLEFTMELDQRKFFKDAAHLNKKGAKIYSDWLVNKIGNKIREGSR